MTVMFRPSTPEDHEAAIAVWLAANLARRDGRPMLDGVEARARAFVRKPDGFLIVGDRDGTVVAMGLGLQGLADDGAGPPIPGLCHISMVFVAPEAWGQGLGGRLVDELLREARSRGYTHVQLWTHSDNFRAQRLYEGRGFVWSGREKVEGDEEVRHYNRPL